MEDWLDDLTRAMSAVEVLLTLTPWEDERRPMLCELKNALWLLAARMQAEAFGLARTRSDSSESGKV